MFRYRLLETLEKNVARLYHVATKVCLKVLYVQLNHARMLMESDVYASQSFGVWWVLHVSKTNIWFFFLIAFFQLLYGQKLSFYQRDYRAMAVRDGLIPCLCRFMKMADRKNGFLTMLSLECLWLLSLDKNVKRDLLMQGVLDVLVDMKDMLLKGSELGVLTISNLLCHPEHFEDHFSHKSTLRSTAAHFICQNSDIDQYPFLLQMCDLYQFRDLFLFFLSSCYHLPLDSNMMAQVTDDKLKQTLLLLKDVKELSNLILACDLPTTFELSLRERCLVTFCDCAKEGNTQKCDALSVLLGMINVHPLTEDEMSVELEDDLQSAC
jgi:hypothetical protein